MTVTRTPRGPIRHGGKCKDDYNNIKVYDQPPKGSGAVIKLQGPAMRAFRAAERDYGKRTGRPKEWRPILLTGSWRSCAYQTELYARDTKRYASPDGTLHCRALAIDVHQEQPNLRIIHRCLKRAGWVQSRPDDEPWHYSYWVYG